VEDHVNRFHGKVVVITGAASGFGAAASRRFAAEGASVVVADIDEAGATAVTQELGPQAATCRVDVRDSSSVGDLVAFAETTFGGVDVMINNAGVARPPRPVEEITDEEYDAVMDINVRGVWHGVRHAVPALRRRGGGVIINTSSSGVQPVSPMSAIYIASKGAVYSMTRELAVELAPAIRVNCVLPSLADTNLAVGSLGMRLDDAAKEAGVARIPMGRLCAPEDVAAAMAFLASDDGSYLTGVCLPVDGGKAV
jgi:3-oxoacyl-[acyl-carrier protein] reductase